MWVIIIGGTQICERTSLLENVQQKQQQQQQQDAAHLMYIWAIGFVHHSDQTVHFGHKIVLLLPAGFSWVVVHPDQSFVEHPHQACKFSA